MVAYPVASWPRIGFAALGVLLLVGLAGCAGTSQKSIYGPGPNGRYVVGKPYQISGQWYFPAEDPAYDRVGLASWYGREFHGNPTANGETFNARHITAAHTTLPMPVLVRVTNLENGQSLLVRVNDRGPFVDGRLIDVSEAAAEKLGFRGQGIARVRVQYVGRADQSELPIAAAQPLPPGAVLVGPPPTPAHEPQAALTSTEGLQRAIEMLPSGARDPLTQ